MRWRTLISSDISAVSYSRTHKILLVEFHSGAQYAYKDVPYALYLRLLRAKSHGQFFHQHIKDKFDYQQIETETLKTGPSLEEQLQQSLEQIKFEQ